MDHNLPHYTHERLLGKGGMGKVYLATDNQLQCKVAIKELTYLTKSQVPSEKVNHTLKEARLNVSG
ncbi:MAG: serine/threonine protein kinase [Paraglaciecola sp.]|jgi:serine/threonine protein kinase